MRVTIQYSVIEGCEQRGDGKIGWARMRRKGSGIMQGQQINRISGKVLIGLSLIALATVMSGYLQAPQADEGAAAHIFQLSIAALLPTILLFVFTADWKQAGRSARPLAFSGAALVVAFGALYYLEHYR